MKKLKFTKMVGSGNDFIIIKGKPVGNLPRLAKTLCDRKFGIGADGMLLLDKCKDTDLSMRIFNADGSEAEMCGNGARCAAFFSGRPKARLRTAAGVINVEVHGNQVKIQLTAPKDIKLDIPLIVNGRSLNVNFINTGVPHVVIFVSGIDDIDLKSIGRSIRRHRKFSPRGTNVNFVQEKGKNFIQIRTYERGVEDETLACGTGSTAAALIFALKNNLDNLVKVQTQSGETLKITFQKENGEFRKVWLEGSVEIVYKGECYV
ncbi:MAG: diaminopimelate epimerase [Candidatus Omnitrophica bacterium]|nr:diaminopimelate epimerase [Candidatus Omnitrophota bacterium]